MFTESDIKSIFALFPPQTSADFVPRLSLASSGNGFVTLQFVQANFRSRVMRETERILLSEFANDLDISTTLVQQLVQSHPGLCLLSADQESIIPTSERDIVLEKLSKLLSSGLHAKADLVASYDVCSKSLDDLLTNMEQEIINIDEFLCTKSYENEISANIKSKVRQALDEMQIVTVSPEDLSGNPPAWFISRILEELLQSEDLASKITIEKDSTRVTCTPKQLVESRRHATIESLKSGELPCLDLKSFGKEYSKLVPAYDDAVSFFEKIDEADIVDTFAVSKPWVAQIEHSCIRILEQEGCTLDVAQVIGSHLPPSIRDRIVAQIKDSIIAAFAERPQEQRIIRVGPLILTEARRECALEELAGYTKADAETQWQALRNDPTRTEDIKFSRERIRERIPSNGLVQRLLTDEKPVERMLDEHFWQAIAALEATNEADFAAYWTDRVIARFQTYQAGLSHVGDEKLRQQLAELLAAYVHQDLVPDTIAKARAQGLVLSRKTRKNLTRLSSILDAAKTMDVPSMTTALEKFAKKQGIAAPEEASLAKAKQGMMDDMLRRLQKQKASDGPVLFLMLVIVLFAKRHDGVVYATGKFAPKLLKQLKGSMSEEQYQTVEKWKEAAKTSSLTAEDRADMVKMAEE
ncbi:hypothetical protein yc1106_10066 [Curvularia clavata]|uniref:Uncharacterized protein n=1 Tax=Curvularia clavata TaxID=95742 RepID=A0A9Q9DXC6_CURCL|nr:hypothetical protein yc1106_10066 [Curvularia clavata]